jgi:DNA repair protein RecO (recombination protein O)
MAVVATYRDEGVVLRTHKLGEADRIVTVLTRSRGKVRAVGKGVRRTTSRFGSRLEPFTRVDLQCHVGKSLDVVTEVSALDAFGNQLSDDYARYTAGTAMLETADRLTEEGEPAVQQYLLLVGGLRALAEVAHAPGLILDSYLLRSLAVAGYAPALLDCARCGSPGTHRGFSVPGGGAVCPACRQPGTATVTADTMHLLGALLAGDWEFADSAEERSRREATGVVTAYLQWHLERGLRSLPLVDRG